MQKLILAFVMVILLSGCVQPPVKRGGANVKAEEVEAGDSIAVEYRGTLEDGTQFDSSEGRGPLEFVAGSGQMIKGFDNAVIGMALNQEKTVTIPAKDAYGEYDKTKLVELPKSQFADADKLVEGLPVHTSEGISGTIEKIKENTIVVNFNHPLAGKSLTFWIKVVKIEKA